MREKSADQFSEAETARRRDETVRRMIATPPKPHAKMKLGKGTAAIGPKKTRPASKGRVHKGRTPT